MLRAIDKVILILGNRSHTLYRQCDSELEAEKALGSMHHPKHAGKRFTVVNSTLFEGGAIWFCEWRRKAD